MTSVDSRQQDFDDVIRSLKVIGAAPPLKLLNALVDIYGPLDSVKQPEDDFTLLMAVAENKALWTEYGMILLESGMCDPCVMDIDNSTVLDHVIKSGSWVAYDGILSFVKRQYDPPVVRAKFIDHVNKFSDYPLCQAIAHGRSDMFKDLLEEQGARIQTTGYVENILGIALVKEWGPGYFEQLLNELANSAKYTSSQVRSLLMDNKIKVLENETDIQVTVHELLSKFKPPQDVSLLVWGNMRRALEGLAHVRGIPLI
jgi:hypothetical protein